MVIVESVYSMDGDCADLSQLSKIKKRYGNIILYVDEAHSVGVRGHAGLGESVAQNVANDIDILVGTFGKALASMGAFAVVNQEIRKYLINTSRSFIFSTVLPPLQVAWTEFVWKYALEADSLRDQLKRKSKAVSDLIPGGESSHIRPLIVGDSDKAVKISQMLLKEGIKALPIRRPTVPPGTERLRFSVCATIPDVEIEHLGHVLKKIAI